MPTTTHKNRLVRCWNCPKKVDKWATFCPVCSAYKPGSEWSHFWARRRLEEIGNCGTCGKKILRKNKKKCPYCGRPRPVPLSEEEITDEEWVEVKAFWRYVLYTAIIIGILVWGYVL